MAPGLGLCVEGEEVDMLRNWIFGVLLLVGGWAWWEIDGWLVGEGFAVECVVVAIVAGELVCGGGLGGDCCVTDCDGTSGTCV